MDIGPVEYLLIEFEGNHFTGEIAAAMRELMDAGTIRLIDAIIVSKDELGNVVHDEYDATDAGDGWGFAGLEVEGVLMSDDDIAAAAAALAPSSTAMLIVWEDLWARRLGKALLDANGRIAMGGRIPRQVVLDALGDAAG